MGDFLDYYSNNSLEDRKGSIPLSDIINVSGHVSLTHSKDNVFTIVTKQKQYILQSTSSVGKQGWLDVLENALSYMDLNLFNQTFPKKGKNLVDLKEVGECCHP